MTVAPEAPRPAERPRPVVSPHGTRVDEYAWLRDDSRADPAVLAHLRAENAYRESLTRRLQPLVDRLYDEIVGRIQQDDDSVPYVYRGFRYWRRYTTGREYPVYLRCVDTAGAPEEVRLQVLKGAERGGRLREMEALVDTCMNDYDENGWTGDTWLPPLNRA